MRLRTSPSSSQKKSTTSTASQRNRPRAPAKPNISAPTSSIKKKTSIGRTSQTGGTRCLEQESLVIAFPARFNTPLLVSGDYQSMQFSAPTRISLTPNVHTSKAVKTTCLELSEPWPLLLPVRSHNLWPTVIVPGLAFPDLRHLRQNLLFLQYTP